MAGPALTVSPVEEDIYAVEGPCEPGVEVRALLVTGRDWTALLDTLSRPSDLEVVCELVLRRGRPLLIVNSHADWDHWWGNAAFPDTPIIAHELTLERQRREGRRALAAQRRKDAAYFGEVELRPATVAFQGRITLHLGGLHLELHHLPGHTRDCIVAFIPERKLLFAGDTAEDPIPLLNEGPVGEWPEGLLHWAERAVTVVPAHGSVDGPELLRRNTLYLRGLLADPGREIPELAGAEPFYRRAHRRNLKRAAGRS